MYLTGLIMMFFGGTLLYVAGVVLMFRKLAPELNSTVWVVIWSVIWPLGLIVFGVMYVFFKLEEVHRRISMGGRND